MPYFTYKEKNMGLPKLGNTGMSRKETVETDKEKKEIVFKATSQRDV